MTSYQPHTPVLMFNLRKKKKNLWQLHSLWTWVHSFLLLTFRVTSKGALRSTSDPWPLNSREREPKEQWFLFLRRSWGFWASQALHKPQEAWHHSSPVQPSQQGLGSANELHYRSQELVGGLAGRVPIVGWTLPPATYVILQIVGRCSQFQNQVLHIIGFKAIILWEIKSKEKA